MGTAFSLRDIEKVISASNLPSTIDLEVILAAFLRHHPKATDGFIRKAFEFGEEAHHGQVRKSGEPYFVHPLAVAYILAESKFDMETVAAGFLHDVIEDCNIDLKTIEIKFGSGLSKIVDGVTKIGQMNFRDKSQAQAVNYRKMVMAMSEDVRVLLVKLADRYHNMLTLYHLPEQKRRRIAQETLDIYAPLAHRIGMGHFKTELERLSFFYLEPDAYLSLDHQMGERKMRNSVFIEEITSELNQLLKKNGVDGEITSRIKSHHSIYKKVVKKSRSLDGIYDYYAFRILTNSVENCYKIFGLLHGHWRHIPGRIKDFIATPKSNLYQSLHTTLINHSGGTPFEVQIRTFMMHRLAEEGVAAHWTYKDGRLMSVGRNEMVAWLKRLAAEQEEVHDNDEFLETMKGHLQTDEILVFTPKNEIKTLPKGSTPLDFAYLIHTEVGHKTIGVKVDGKMVPLDSELQSGSIVEVLTSPHQKPGRQWLKVVRTASARAKIRAWLRKEEKSKAIEIGRTLFERELKKYKVPLKSITKDVISKELGTFKINKLEDFYSSIGFGKLTPFKAAKPFLPEENLDLPSGSEVRKTRHQKAMERVSKKSKSQVLVKGQGDLLVYLAKCCNPIIGDPITGYISLGRGVAVHKKECKNMIQALRHPERIIDVEWAPVDGQGEKVEASLFNVRMRVHTEDRPGMIRDITSAISDGDTNVKRMSAETNKKDGRGEFDIVVEVRSLDHFEQLVNRLRRVKGFLACERMT